MKLVDLHGTKLDAAQYAIQGNAVLGIKDSGKSYFASFMGERLIERHIPIIAFDPIGVWRFLRVAANGDGFPVVVAGGEHGDLPLTPQGAPEIVRAAMRGGVSLVLDLYSMNLSKSDWRSIVERSVEVLLYENKAFGLRHIFLEEAAEFCPQKIAPDQGKVYSVIEKLARMGGNAHLGYTLINQRAEEVNKAVLELCDSLFLFRQKGKNSLLSLAKWLDAAGLSDAKSIAASLPTLKQGECWAWLSGEEKPIRIPRVPEKKTFHPDRRQMHGTTVTHHKALDVSSFVEQMKDALEKVVAEAKANDPSELKKEIARLKKDFTARSNGSGIDSRALERARADGRREGEEATLASLSAQGDKRDRQIAELVGRFLAAAEKFGADIQAVIGRPMEMSRLIYKSTAAPKVQPPCSNGSAVTIPMAEKMGKAERAVLIAIVQFPASDRDRIGIISGYSPNSGHFANVLGALRSRGWIEAGQPLQATESGIVALGDYEPLPTGDSLIEYWRGKLGKAERAIFDAAVEAYPNTIARETLGERAGYSASSGHFANCLGKLRTLQLITRGTEISAHPALFE